MKYTSITQGDTYNSQALSSVQGRRRSRSLRRVREAWRTNEEVIPLEHRLHPTRSQTCPLARCSIDGPSRARETQGKTGGCVRSTFFEASNPYHGPGGFFLLVGLLPRFLAPLMKAVFFLLPVCVLLFVLCFWRHFVLHLPARRQVFFGH